MTQEDVARAIKTTKQAIYKYENNIVTNIPMDKVEAIAKSLNTTPAYLMGWTSDWEAGSGIAGRLTEKERKALHRYIKQNENGDWVFDFSGPDEETTAAESSLLYIYRKLNEDGQEKLLDYADDLAGMEKYKRTEGAKQKETAYIRMAGIGEGGKTKQIEVDDELRRKTAEASKLAKERAYIYRNYSDIFGKKGKRGKNDKDDNQD